MLLWIVWRTRLWIVERRGSESFGGHGSGLLKDAALIHLEGKPWIVERRGSNSLRGRISELLRDAVLNRLEDVTLDC